MKLSVSELKAKNLSHCVLEDVFKIEQKIDKPTESIEKTITEINAYLSIFAKPERDEQNYQLCLCCGERLSGILGTFRYLIVHGEGECSECGWPARANHYDFGPVKAFEGVLQYHPDEVREKQSPPHDP